MKKKNFLKILLIFIIIIFTWFIYSNYFKKNIRLMSETTNATNMINTSNTINTDDIKSITTDIEEEFVSGNTTITVTVAYTQVINFASRYTLAESDLSKLSIVKKWQFLDSSLVTYGMIVY